MVSQKSIVSPIPGVFYRKPSPDEQEFVQVNQKVNAGDTIGIIEVMKNFFEIKAEEDGVIVSFLVDNEELVDAGKEIAVLETA